MTCIDKKPKNPFGMGTSHVTGSSEMILSAHHLMSGGWSKAKSALEAASGVSGWWLHDLRRTLATRQQHLGVRLEVTEAVLNHLSGSRADVVGIYQVAACARAIASGYPTSEETPLLFL